MLATDRKHQLSRTSPALVMMLLVLRLQNLAPFNEVTDVFAADPNASDIAHHDAAHHSDHEHQDHTAEDACPETGHAGCHSHQHTTPTTLPQRWSVPQLSSVTIKQSGPFVRPPHSPVTGIYRPPIA